MPRSSRLALCCLAICLIVSLYVKGRVPAGKGEGAVFLRPAAGKVKVRLAGDFPQPGLYLFPDGASPRSAIKMTLSAKAPDAVSGADPDRPLHSGDVVTLTLTGAQAAVLTLGEMGVNEKILLKIPLDPDRLTPEQWSSLPGIGEVLAARIVTERQKTGAFGSVEGLLRVPGIGPGKLAALKPYF